MKGLLKTVVLKLFFPFPNYQNFPLQNFLFFKVVSNLCGIYKYSDSFTKEEAARYLTCKDNSSDNQIKLLNFTI
jgi:hypothetical protein